MQCAPTSSHQQSVAHSWEDDALPVEWIICPLQGVALAKQAWKRRNAVPVTNKEVKDQRPTGRGGFGVGQAGGRAAGDALHTS